MGFIAPILGSLLSTVVGSMIQGAMQPSQPSAAGASIGAGPAAAAAPAQAAPPVTATSTQIGATDVRPSAVPATDGSTQVQQQQAQTQPAGSGFTSPTGGTDLLTNKELI